MSRKWALEFAVSLLFVVSSGAMVCAETIYFQDFGATGGNVALGGDLNGDGWNWGNYLGSTATDNSSSTSDLYVQAQTYDADGRYLVMTSNTLGLATVTPSESVAIGDLQSVSWVANYNKIESSTRVVVKIGTEWYATDQDFSMWQDSNYDQWDEKAETLSFTWTNAKSAWRSLTFDPGTELALATETIDSDLSGNVTSFGLLIHRTDHVRIDNFTITAVPEPTTCGLVATVGLCLAVVGWRRTTSPTRRRTH